MSGRRTIDATVRLDTPDSFAEWEDCGSFDRGAAVFRVERIPAPPEAKRVEIADPIGEGFIGYQIACACRHCGQDVDFIFGQPFGNETMRELLHLREEVKRLREQADLMESMAGTFLGALKRERAERDED